MAYENIEINKLKKALNKIDNINSNKLEKINDKINSSEWSSGVENRIKEAIKKEISEIKAIQTKINNYKDACDYIKEYQKLDDDIDGYNNSLSSYRNKLSSYNDKLSDYQTTMKNYDSDTPDVSKAYTQGRIDHYNNKISNAKDNIADINSKMSSAKSNQASLKIKIDNLIN